MKSKLIILAVLILFLSYSCTPKAVKDKAKRYVYEWWYGNSLGDAKAFYYDGGWIDNWRHPLIGIKHTKLRTNKEKTYQEIFYWFEREEYKRVENTITKETESDNMIVRVFRLRQDRQWREWRVNQVRLDSRYSHSDAEDTFNDLK